MTPNNEAKVPLLSAGLFGLALMAACASSGESRKNDNPLPVGNGYVLVRVVMPPTSGPTPETRDYLVFSEYDTDESFAVRTRTPHSAGLYAWMSMASVPSGRYYYSHFRSSVTFALTTPHASKDQVTSNDIFIVKPEVINYVGDWTLKYIRGRASAQYRVATEVTYDWSTLGKVAAVFPGYLEKYDLYLSMKGKQAVSTREILDLADREANSQVR